MNAPSLVWFRPGDLRLADNPALQAANAEQNAVIPFFASSVIQQLGAASRWWLHESLSALSRDLAQHGSRLILRIGSSPEDIVRALVTETGARSLFWNRGYTPLEQRDEASLTALGLRTCAFNARLLVDPLSIRREDGETFHVFSAFWRRAQDHIEAEPPGASPARIVAPPTWPMSAPLQAFKLLPRPDWARGLRAAWTPGEDGARRTLEAFTGPSLAGYAQRRNIPSIEGTSRLSPHVHFGETSPRQVWWGVQRAQTKSADAFRRELGWREYAAYLLFQHPELARHSLDTAFDSIDWRDDETDLAAWQQGRTGYPLVDAGMRQLWATGWMHNRVRMVVASFLVKDLLLPWQVGADWFLDTLVDADLANNTLGWQWAAGAGADAAPFPRVFNPTLQAQRFDPHGDYIRRYVPELARLPAPYVLQPWTTSPTILTEAGVRLGENYPRPIVDHALARQRALRSFGATRSARPEPRRRTGKRL